jgi:hypothetical protein
MNVQGPDGAVVSFPDGTDPATVDQVMRQNFGGQQQGDASQWGPGQEAVNAAGFGLGPKLNEWLGKNAPTWMMGGAKPPSAAQEQANASAYEQQNPKMAMAASLAGGSLPFLATGGAAAPLGLAGRMGAMAATGAASGAIPALANGDQNVLLPTAVGAGLGAGAELGGTGASKLAGAILGRLGYGSAGATRAGLKAATGTSYGNLEASGAQFDPNAIRDMAAQAQQDLFRTYHPTSTPTTNSVLEDLQKVPAASASPSFGIRDFEAARKQLGNVPETNPGDAGYPDYAAANLVRAHLDRFLDAPPPGALLSSNAGSGASNVPLSDLAREARANAQSGFQYDALNRLAGKGQLDADTSHSGLNVSNNIRQKLKTLIDPGVDDQTANVSGYTPENSQTLNDIVRGTGPQNAVRYTGNLLGKGGGLGAMVAGGLLGHALGSGELGAMIGMGAGRSLAGIDNALTKSKVKALQQAVIAASPYGQAAGPAVAPALAAPTGRMVGAVTSPLVRALMAQQGQQQQP